MEYSPRQGYDKSKTLLVFNTKVLGHHHHHLPLLVWVAPSFEYQSKGKGVGGRWSIEEQYIKVKGS
jgi:hypothetical protein